MSSRREGDDRSDSVAVLLSIDSRSLRRALRPLVWVILEEVALDAVVEDGRLVARTSARQVAEQLGVNPTTASEALRVLGRRGLISLEREKGPAGRFGLSVYALGPVTGLTVVSPCVADPYVDSPRVEAPVVVEVGTVSRYTGQPWVKTPTLAPDVDRADMDLPDTTDIATALNPDGEAVPSQRVAGGRAPRKPSSSACPGQETLDFGWGASS